MMAPMNNKKFRAAIIISALLISAASTAFMLQPNRLVSANSVFSQQITFSDSFSVSAAPSLLWNQTYGGTEWDSAQSVIQTSDGGYALAGSTRSLGAGWSDFWLIKVDSLGNTEWNKTYGGAGEDVAQAVIQTIDGGYALVGRTAASAWFVKTDSSGKIQWNRTYNENYGETKSGCLNSLIQTRDGSYALVGYTDFVPSFGGSFWLIKTDAAGNMQWNKTYGGNGASSVIQTSDGGYALAGYIGSSMPDYYLVKTDSEGNMQWGKNYGSQDKDIGFSVVQADDGGYVEGGWMWSRSNGGGSNIALVKTDANGNLQWNRTYGAGEGWSTAKTSDGGYVIAGSKLVKTDSAGNEQWEMSFEDAGSTSYHQAYSVIQTLNGGFALAGVVANGTTSDAWLAKIESGSSSQSSQPSPSASTSPSPTSTQNLTPSPTPSIPEFPTWTALTLFMAASGFFIVFRRRVKVK